MVDVCGPVFVKLKLEIPSIRCPVSCLWVCSPKVLSISFQNDPVYSSHLPQSAHVPDVHRGFCWAQNLQATPVNPPVCLQIQNWASTNLKFLSGASKGLQSRILEPFFRILCEFSKAECLGRILPGSQQALARSLKVVNVDGNRQSLVTPYHTASLSYLVPKRLDIENSIGMGGST